MMMMLLTSLLITIMLRLQGDEWCGSVIFSVNLYFTSHCHFNKVTYFNFQDQMPVHLWLSLLCLKLLLWGRQSLWAVQPVKELIMISAGIYRNLDSLPNCCFTKSADASLILRVISAAVDLSLSSLWQSMEFRLQMQEITTVWVNIEAQSSHSDTESYKNLPQLLFAVLQLWASDTDSDMHHWFTESTFRGGN